MGETTIGTPVGPYGTVIEHPLIRGLFYMVIGPTGKWRVAEDFYGVTLADNSGFAHGRTPGEVVVLGHYLQTGKADWIVVE